MVMKKGIGIDSSVKRFFCEFIRNSSRLFLGRGSYGSSSFGKKLGKSGQVTVFIIVGIVILFATAGIIYVTKTVSLSKLEDVKDPIIASVPQQFQPIQLYVEGCLRDVGKKGLVVLGEQGGYIYPDVVGKFSSKDMTNGDGIAFGDVNVPYWHYNVNENKNPQVKYSTLKPKLKLKDDPVMSVEAQLSRFVKENIDGCLGNYGAFVQEGFIVQDGESTLSDSGKSTVPTDVEVTVAANTVNFWLKRDILVKKGSDATTMEEFYVKIPLQLQKYYAVAEEITGVEQNFSFLERQALDLITTYSGVDREKLPPTEAVRFDAIPKAFWLEKDVVANLKGLLVANVPLLRYYGAENFYRYDYMGKSGKEQVVTDLSELYQKNYDNTILPLELGKGLEVNFDYFGWEPYIDVTDKNGRVEPSNSPVHQYGINLVTQHYFTMYDVSYPVLVTIRDAKAFDSEGYNFVFALESNIRNNQYVKSGYVQPPPIVPKGESLVCDDAQKGTDIVGTLTLDSGSLQPVADVQVVFDVPNEESCVMGLTKADGQLKEKYPAVYGGVASYIKEGYLTTFYPADTYPLKGKKGVIGAAVTVGGVTQNVVMMHKMKPINVRVKKKVLDKCISEKEASVDYGKIVATGDLTTAVGLGAVDLGEDAVCYGQGVLEGTNGLTPIYSYTPSELKQKHYWMFHEGARNLGEDETASIILRRVADLTPSVVGDDYVAAATVMGNNLGSMELVPGIYEVTGLLTDTSGIRIPAMKRCSDGISQVIGCFDTKGCCYDLEEQKLEKLLTGQVEWNVAGMYLAITPEQLYGASEITFYVPTFNERAVPEVEGQRVVEDLQVMGQLGSFSRILRGSLEPTYK